jgi:5'-nucleotidase
MFMQDPIILITNDDGITAPGIRNLIEAAKGLGTLYVVAPDKPQSGMGHAITIHSTLRLQKFDSIENVVEYACSGTPVDCVKIAIDKLLPRKPDLIISGINHGSNSSINIIYSGTMSAAVEGCIEGIPSIGFSLSDFSLNADFSGAKEYARKICKEVLENKLPDGVCLNVNFPKLPKEELKGIKICRQAKALWQEEFDERTDPSGKPYYWLTGKFINLDEGTDTDEHALANGYVSIVPVEIDFTAYHAMDYLKNNFKFQN